MIRLTFNTQLLIFLSQRTTESQFSADGKAQLTSLGTYLPSCMIPLDTRRGYMQNRCDSDLSSCLAPTGYLTFLDVYFPKNSSLGRNFLFLWLLGLNVRIT